MHVPNMQELMQDISLLSQLIIHFPLTRYVVHKLWCSVQLRSTHLLYMT